MADRLILFFGGRTIPVLRYEEAQRFARDQAVRRYYDQARGTYAATAEHFGLSIPTVKRILRTPLIEPWAKDITMKPSR